MMMPANYSAISENEMTYVNGGAVALEDILAPALDVSNWKKFNTNMVTIVGNTFLGSFVSNTVGQLFNGAYKPGNLGKTWWKNTVVDSYKSGYAVGFGTGDSTGAKFLNTNNGVLNVALRLAGSAAAVYNLATANTGNNLPKLVDFDKNEVKY